MIGNLILALGLACVSASALSTDNFTNIPIENSISVGNFQVTSSTLTYNENPTGLNYYQNFSGNGSIIGDGSGDGYCHVIGVKSDLTTSFTQNFSIGNLDDYRYRKIISDNDLAFGFVCISSYSSGTIRNGIYIQMFATCSNESYLVDDVENNFKMDSLIFTIRNLNASINYDLYNGDIIAVRNNSSNYSVIGSLFTNQSYSSNYATMFNSNSSVVYMLPFTIRIPTNSGTFSVFLSNQHIVDNTNYDDGYNNGYTIGYHDGLSEGYGNGYAEGIRVGTSANADVKNLFGVIADTPIRFLKDMFNFELFGMNVAVVILSCLSAIVVFTLIKKIWK